MKIAAFVPVKLTNERLPGKNTKTLGNKPLIQYQQEELLKLQSELSGIYIFCSDPHIKDYLIDGVEYIQRPVYLDGNRVKGNEIYREFIKTVDADYYLLVHATAPFVKSATIAKMIQAIQTEEYDSAFAAFAIQKFLWRDNKPLNFDITELPRTQDLKPIYVDQCGPYIFSRDLFMSYNRRIGFKPYIQELTFRESIDIDTKEDFELAEKYVDCLDDEHP